MTRFYVNIGDQVTFAKTISESDVYQFAGITGDFSAIHINSEYAKKTPLGQRVVHGVLLIGLMSTTGTLLIDKYEVRGPDEQSYSVGYDRVRFIKPVFLGDTVTVTDTVVAIDEMKKRCRSKAEIHNQHGQIVCAAEHLIQWVSKAAATESRRPRG
jgi:3-hydroxybutyryl-CoA dehydratase